MNVDASALADLTARLGTADGALIRTVVNSTSATETGFALGLLAERLPNRTLVAALNLRETLSEIPEAPFPMRVDFETLARVARLERRGQSWVRLVTQEPGTSEIEILGQGNLCYDVVVRLGESSSLLKPAPINGDFVKPRALELILSAPGLLADVIELMGDMGMVHNPRFYLDVDDWQMEHAVEAFHGISDLF